MARHINKKAGAVRAVPGLNVANFVSLAISPYQSTAPAAIELAARKVAYCFGVSHEIARTIAELAGMGGRT
jgi:hypothetical protein